MILFQVKFVTTYAFVLNLCVYNQWTNDICSNFHFDIAASAFVTLAANFLSQQTSSLSGPRFLRIQIKNFFTLK